MTKLWLFMDQSKNIIWYYVCLEIIAKGANVSLPDMLHKYYDAWRRSIVWEQFCSALLLLLGVTNSVLGLNAIPSPYSCTNRMVFILPTCLPLPDTHTHKHYLITSAVLVCSLLPLHIVDRSFFLSLYLVVALCIQWRLTLYEPSGSDLLNSFNRFHN